MIDILHYENGLTCTVFDEPFEEYYEVILSAQEDDHRLSQNYHKNILKDMEFMCLWKSVDGRRAMYGLQRDNGLPRNVARGFSRYYTPKDERSYSQDLESPFYRPIFLFYKEHPEYHTRIGVDTLFFTREVRGTRKDIMIQRMSRLAGFTRHPEPRYYKNTLQHFYVSGNSNFILTLSLSEGDTK
jgi:hypothetical protein